MTFATADLADAHPGLQVAEPIFADFGGLERFSGMIVTLRTFEDNSRVRMILERPGEGRVLVIDGGGSLRCALVGGNLAKLAETRGWAGILVHGAVRDVAELEAARIGLKALAPVPRKSRKENSGAEGEVLAFAGVTFAPGAFLYADGDGIVLADRALA